MSAIYNINKVIKTMSTILVYFDCYWRNCTEIIKQL